MNTLDIILITGLGVIVIYSFIRGLINMMVSLLSTILGIWIAIRYYPFTAKFVGEMTNSQMAANIIGFLIIFFVVSLSVSVIGKIIKKLLDIGRLGWIDRGYYARHRLSLGRMRRYGSLAL
jgi:membrane protein required for colicin V production